MYFDAFLMVFDFTQFWLDGRPGNEYFLIPHNISGLLAPPWHPWVCVRSDLKQIWAIPPTVATGSLILNKIDPFWTMCSGGAAQPAAASIAGKKK